MRLHLTRARSLAVATTLAAGVLVGLFGAGAATASTAAATPVPRVPAGLPATIEPMGGYVGDDSCDPHTRPGTRKLAELLAHTYRNYRGTVYNTTYSCGTDATRSEHYDGRAIDWMVDVHDRRQHAAALATLRWLLATDAHGNRFAMARRLGVMYLIYDNRIWGGWDGKWEPYGDCAHEKGAAYANSCHRTHIHISLTWNGAMGRTSYWTGKVFPTDYGPCRPRDLNWAGRYTGRNLQGCPSYPDARAPKGSSATKKLLVEYSGARAHRGSSGPVTEAVQRGLHLSPTGSYDASTVARVEAFQRAHHLPVSGVMNASTWRALLRATH